MTSADNKCKPFSAEELQEFAEEFADAIIDQDRKRRKIPMSSYPREALMRLVKSTCPSAAPLSNQDTFRMCDHIISIIDAYAQKLNRTDQD
jgi:benzoyl-CoA reductase/2-hydroxyglutaryl-CoA dehydratase subunit BcrC/BadD/HgdB